jgi:DNA mismatch endonuclease (patch repair protein)
MQGNTARDTRPEVAVRSAVHALGLRFRKHASPLPGLRCRADLVFTRQRVVVFVDGCFWHGCPEHGVSPTTNSSYWHAKLGGNVDRDRRNDAALADAGWTVVRVWEHEEPQAAALRIASAVRAAGANVRSAS